MGHRQCIVRRYLNERTIDKNLHYVPKTRENPSGTPVDSLDEIKSSLLKDRGVRVRDALEVVNQRDITYDEVRAFQKRPEI